MADADYVLILDGIDCRDKIEFKQNMSDNSDKE